MMERRATVPPASEGFVWSELRLTAFEADDIDALHRWQEDPEIRHALIGARFPLSRVQLTAWVDSLAAPTARPQRLAQALPVGDGLAGAGVLADIDWLHRSATVAALASPDAPDPSGLCAAALARLTSLAFDALDFQRLEAQVEAGSADEAMFSQLGFEIEGRRRSAVYRAGTRRDLVVFSCLNASGETSAA